MLENFFSLDFFRSSTKYSVKNTISAILPLFNLYVASSAIVNFFVGLYTYYGMYVPYIKILSVSDITIVTNLDGGG